MIKSMTGFGRSEYLSNGREYTVEIKTVNHRYNDVSIRLPRQYSFLEEHARKLISKHISRGKIDVNITITEFKNEDRKILFDEGLIKSYIKEAELLDEGLGIKNDLSFSRVMNLPEVVKVSADMEEEKIVKEFDIVLKDAIGNLGKMREVEGESLKKDIILKSENLLKIFKEIENKSECVVEEYREKLKNRLDELTKNTPGVIDENRFAAEVAIFADKSSIDEELVRFKSHISQLIKTLDIEEPIGKKLDFIVQEMNREVNTIGSKANNLDITRAVIELKNEIEKIREQIQNIE